MLAWLRKWITLRDVGFIESEVARERTEVERLRAENRALLNSLLGTAGFPPVEFPEAPKPQPVPRLRKRSWHQFQAARETQAVRDASAELADEAPPRTRAAPHSE